MFLARVIINGQATDGKFTKSFLLRLYRMGAEITVSVAYDNGTVLDLENKDDYCFFRNYNGE